MLVFVAILNLGTEFLKAGDAGMSRRIFLSLRKMLVVERKTIMCLLIFVHISLHNFVSCIWSPQNKLRLEILP